MLLLRMVHRPLGREDCPSYAGLLLTTLVFMILYAVEKHDSGRWPSWASFQQSHPASEAVDVSFSPEGTHPGQFLTPCTTYIQLA